MPLPDAINRSPRVYTLLQNLDLENITADTLADVADPIAIEEQNEDELRRLCLVAFARMVTKGSFDGWTETLCRPPFLHVFGNDPAIAGFPSLSNNPVSTPFC